MAFRHHQSVSKNKRNENNKRKCFHAIYCLIICHWKIECIESIQVRNVFVGCFFLSLVLSVFLLSPTSRRCSSNRLCLHQLQTRKFSSSFFSSLHRFLFTLEGILRLIFSRVLHIGIDDSEHCQENSVFILLFVVDTRIKTRI